VVSCVGFCVADSRVVSACATSAVTSGPKANTITVIAGTTANNMKVILKVGRSSIFRNFASPPLLSPG
jgi:hypothetical protein